MQKIRCTYREKLNSMAFVANARPGQARQAGLTVKLPKTLGHACLFAEQGNRVRIPDTEGISFLRLQPMNHRVQRRKQDSESSCISKVLFSVQRNLCAVKTGHWKGCHGSERRLKQCVCVGRMSPAHEWISQKTYKPRNEELTAWR